MDIVPFSQICQRLLRALRTMVILAKLADDFFIMFSALPTRTSSLSSPPHHHAWHGSSADARIVQRHPVSHLPTPSTIVYVEALATKGERGGRQQQQSLAAAAAAGGGGSCRPRRQWQAAADGGGSGGRRRRRPAAAVQRTERVRPEAVEAAGGGSGSQRRGWRPVAGGGR